MKVALLIFFGIPVWAIVWTAWCAEAAPKSLLADLDGDGKSERIAWVKFAETKSDGDFYQVRVTDAGGGLVWESPKVADTENPLVFGDWHFGYSLPELAADIDGDGAIEMLAPAPQSDVSPTWFRAFRWKAGGFEAIRSGILLESPEGSGQFPWSVGDEWKGTWISSFFGANADGSLNVELSEYRGGVDMRQGKAKVISVEGGYKIWKWTETMRPPPDAPVADPATGSPKAGSTYRARLSAQDHFNSAGDRLEKVGDILRQDRANFHRNKGDDEDSNDHWFGTREARDKMDTMRVVAVGEVSKAIVEGSPLVEVEVSTGELKVVVILPRTER